MEPSSTNCPNASFFLFHLPLCGTLSRTPVRFPHLFFETTQPQQGCKLLWETVVILRTYPYDQNGISQDIPARNRARRRTIVLKDLMVTIARVFHLFPFRTEKLSPSALMVLGQTWKSRSLPISLTAFPHREGFFFAANSFLLFG